MPKFCVDSVTRHFQRLNAHGQETMENDSPECQPSTSISQVNIHAVCKLLKGDKNYSI